MSSERRSRQKTTRMAGRRATFRGEVVYWDPPENGCYSMSEWHIALFTQPGKAHHFASA
jgi:hypothetical protein